MGLATSPRFGNYVVSDTPLSVVCLLLITGHHTTPTMKTITALLAVASSLFVAAFRSQAAVLYGPVTNANNGHIYYLLTISTWTQAQAGAESLGGNLTTINDQLEHLWVYSTFGSYLSQPRQLWIGLTDREIEGEFTWNNGEPVGFTNWGTGEPNNANGAEDFVVIMASNASEPGKWNDLQDSVPSYGVVEIIPPLALLIRVSEVTVSWLSQPGKNYQVQFKESASDPSWDDLGPVRPGTGGVLDHADPVTEPGRIYQVVEVQ